MAAALVMDGLETSISCSISSAACDWLPMYVLVQKHANIGRMGGFTGRFTTFVLARSRFRTKECSNASHEVLVQFSIPGPKVLFSSDAASDKLNSLKLQVNVAAKGSAGHEGDSKNEACTTYVFVHRCLCCMGK